MKFEFRTFSRFQKLIFSGAVGLAFCINLGAQDSYNFHEILTASSPSTSRSKEWKPGDGVALEVSGMAWMGDGKLAVATRKGDIWIIDGVLSDKPDDVKFSLFASGLHEPLGLTKEGDDLLTTQRSEVTRLRDKDGDGVADGYLTEADGWNVSGAYHAYAYGPELDGAGEYWVTLNLDMGPHTNNHIGWRGWGGTIGKDGKFQPQSFGMRSPSGMGANAAGDLFFSDQQGTWIPATPIYHLRKGVFYGNQESAKSQEIEGSPMKIEMPKANVPYPQALRSSKEFVPPAVWLPYNKVGRSGTDVQLIDADGKFGPFDGQLLIGEFTNAGVNRVFLEKVGGEYQGACFPFLSGFPAAVLRLEFSDDGPLFVGMTNRGWSSLGNRSYGLVRVDYDPKVPSFAIQEMRAKPDGFELEFTQPVDRETVLAAGAFELENYTYQYSQKYGGDEIQKQILKIELPVVSNDGLTVRLKVDGLREFYVHELRTKGIKSASGGKSLDSPMAYYTLNQIPLK